MTPMRGETSPGWLAAPTWLVNGAKLRETLDELRAALAAPPLLVRATTGETLVHDHKAIGESLRFVLDRLATVDLTATQALSGVVREFRSESLASHLRALFDDLERGLSSRVAGILGPTKIKTVGRLLTSPAPDVLRILGREHDENSHSDLIAWLLDPRRAPIVALHALRQLTSHLAEPERWATCLADAVADDSVSVRREFVIGRELAGADDLCRIDIAITGPGFILAIENKVWAREHNDQTRTYWRWLEGCRGLRAGLLVSPSGIAAVSSEFQPLSYLHLVSALAEGPSRAAITASEEIVLASYLKTLARRTIPVEMRAVEQLARSMEAP